MIFSCRCGKNTKSDIGPFEKWKDERAVLDELINTCAYCKPVKRD